MREISSIKPKPQIKSKSKSTSKVSTTKDGEVEGEEEQGGLKFYYSTASYDSYAKEGFKPPEEKDRPDAREIGFLERVNLEYGKVKVKVLRMIRTKAPDYTTEKEPMKEYLVIESDWIGHDLYGAEIRLGLPHEEGRYTMQTKKLYNQVNEKTGRLTSMYVKSTPKTAYNIPFSKETVDKYLKGAHPFGPDSENITDPDRVTFYGKFEYRDTGTMPFRCGQYTYDQFVTPVWRDFAELAARPGGPVGQVWRDKKNEKNQLQHIT